MLAGKTAEDTRLTTFNRLEKELPPLVHETPLSQLLELFPESIPVESNESDFEDFLGIFLRICLSMVAMQQLSAEKYLHLSYTN